ncbi:Cycloartenol synthase [Nymphaea thermarum]|nr:Cycloartenol synthase [Nymphaea thermarum]
MWRLKVAEGAGDPWLRTTNNHVGRDMWEFDPNFGSQEDRKAVEEPRANFTKHRFEKKHSSDLIIRMQVVFVAPLNAGWCGLQAAGAVAARGRPATVLRLGLSRARNWLRVRCTALCKETRKLIDINGHTVFQDIFGNRVENKWEIGFTKPKKARLNAQDKPLRTSRGSSPSPYALLLNPSSGLILGLV